MVGLAIELILDQDPRVRAALLGLNNAHARETSPLTPERWDHLVAHAFAADCVDAPASLLIAFDQAADYDSPNFLWFRDRLARFVYVDRIVVDDSHWGRGFARNLYQGLFRKALDAGHDQVVCEVNLDPPNPRSDAFHARFGFSEIGRDALAGGKAVRYLAKRLDAASGGGART